MKKEGSPLKVKDYFANPIHRIRQPAFVEVGFSQSHLNTFVKTFTNRYHSRYISYLTIRQFIASFTNNNSKLVQMYQDFFLNNFTITQHGDILLEDFISFFTRQEGTSVGNLSERERKRILGELGELNSENLAGQCRTLGMAMKDREAAKIIKMLNFDVKKGGKFLSQQAFFKAVTHSDQVES